MVIVAIVCVSLTRTPSTFDRLVQSLRPSAAGHRASREFVDDRFPSAT
jgi:hypothetical protein